MRTLLLTLLLLALFPATAFAHAIDAPKEFISTLVSNEISGVYTISASQYATEAFTEVEVQLAAFGGVLPEDTAVSIVAESAETQQPYTTTLIRHHNAFTTTLPLNGENWNVTVQVDSGAGVGSAEFTVIPYRAPVESTPLVRNLTFSAPFILAAFALLGFKRAGISLVAHGTPVSVVNG